MNYISAPARRRKTVWIRVNDRMMPNIGTYVSANDEVRPVNTSRRPYIMVWIIPIDDYNNKRLYLMLQRRARSDPGRCRRWEGFGANGRAAVRRTPTPSGRLRDDGKPGTDHHSRHREPDLDRLRRDRMRQMIREGIRAVQEGRDPVGVVRDPNKVIRTRGQSTVVRVPRAATPEEDEQLLKKKSAARLPIRSCSTPFPPR